MTEDEFKITPEIFNDLDMPEPIKKTLMDLIAKPNPWSEDMRYLATAIGGKDCARLIYEVVCELEEFRYIKMDKEDSDEIELILMRMKKDSRRIHDIIEIYAHALDREYFGKEESE